MSRCKYGLSNKTSPETSNRVGESTPWILLRVRIEVFVPDLCEVVVLDLTVNDDSVIIIVVRLRSRTARQHTRGDGAGRSKQTREETTQNSAIGQFRRRAWATMPFLPSKTANQPNQCSFLS